MGVPACILQVTNDQPTCDTPCTREGTFGGAEVDERLPLTAEQFQLRLEEFKDEILQQRRDFLVDSLGTNFQKLTKKEGHWREI